MSGTSSIRQGGWNSKIKGPRSPASLFRIRVCVCPEAQEGPVLCEACEEGQAGHCLHKPPQVCLPLRRHRHSYSSLFPGPSGKG